MTAPLAENMRPQTLADVVGQDHITGRNGFLTSTIERKKSLSLILYGPPGCGKTSIARLYAKALNLPYFAISAIFTGVAELKDIFKKTENEPLIYSKIVLFVDEIHRFNKSQQDAFLPYVENGKIVLIGATAENPSFYLNHALLSRLRVLVLNPLDENALNQLLEQYEKRFSKLPLTKDGRQYLLQSAQGDGRYLFNLVEALQGLPENIELSPSQMQELIQKRSPIYDKAGDAHYNLISALHKSVRGSDPDASLYWLLRMLNAGEDPLFIIRRVIRMATEDIGLADPQALTLAIAAKATYEALGSPEGELAIAEAVVYLALAPKSNAIYKAFGQAKKLAGSTSHLLPPKTILNAPTKMMKEIGYGEGYLYDHDTKEGFSGQSYFPESLYTPEPPKFYQPEERGFEREMKKRMDYFKNLKHTKKEDLT